MAFLAPLVVGIVAGGAGVWAYMRGKGTVVSAETASQPVPESQAAVVVEEAGESTEAA